jgi:hypothetical protein
MPRKSTRVVAKPNMTGGYFWEQKDPYFGSFNKGVAKVAGNIDDELKRSKILSTIARPIITSVGTALGTAAGGYGSSAGAWLGDKAGGYAQDYLQQKGYGRQRGRGRKAPLTYTAYNVGVNPATGPMRSSANPRMKGMRGGATASSQGGVYAPRGYMPGLPESMIVGRTQDTNPITQMRGGAIMGFPNTGVNGSINFNAGALIR